VLYFNARYSAYAQFLCLYMLLLHAHLVGLVSFWSFYMMHFMWIYKLSAQLVQSDYRDSFCLCCIGQLVRFARVAGGYEA